MLLWYSLRWTERPRRVALRFDSILRLSAESQHFKRQIDFLKSGPNHYPMSSSHSCQVVLAFSAETDLREQGNPASDHPRHKSNSFRSQRHISGRNSWCLWTDFPRNRVLAIQLVCRSLSSAGLTDKNILHFPTSRYVSSNHTAPN